jgi:predicted MFS family arabinose efflux permease
MWRFMQGLCIPGIIAVTMAYISEESPIHSVGSIMATYVTGTVVGGFVGRLLAGICESLGYWREAFLLFGLMTLVTAFGVLWQLPRSSKFSRQQGQGASLVSLGHHLQNRQLLTTYFIGFNVLFCLVAMFTYCNFYLADAPFLLSPAELGAIFTVYLIGAVITPISGRMLDRIGYRKTLSIAVCIISAGTLLTVVDSVPIILAGLALASAGVFVCQATASSYVGKVAGQARSSAAGLYVSFYYFGGVSGSILPGIFWRQMGWAGCISLVLCLQAVIMAVGLYYWRDDLGSAEAAE